MRTAAAAATVAAAATTMRNGREGRTVGKGWIKRTSHSRGEEDRQPKKEKRKGVRWPTKMVLRRKRWSRTVKRGAKMARILK